MKNYRTSGCKQGQNRDLFPATTVLDPSLPPCPVLVDLHASHVEAWRALGATGVRHHRLGGVHLPSSDAWPSAILQVLEPKQALGHPALLLSAGARAYGVASQGPHGELPRPLTWWVEPADAPGLAPAPPEGRVLRMPSLPALHQTAELEAWVSQAQQARGLGVSLHHELAALLRQGWAWSAALLELQSRVQALPASCLTLLEVGGFLQWPPTEPAQIKPASMPPNQRVPEGLWEVLGALRATGHAPAVRLAWEQDLPPLAVLLDEAHRAHQALADA
jgi:hypothetical protein